MPMELSRSTKKVSLVGLLIKALYFKYTQPSTCSYNALDNFPFSVHVSDTNRSARLVILR